MTKIRVQFINFTHFNFSNFFDNNHIKSYLRMENSHLMTRMFLFLCICALINRSCNIVTSQERFRKVPETSVRSKVLEVPKERPLVCHGTLDVHWVPFLYVVTGHFLSKDKQTLDIKYGRNPSRPWRELHSCSSNQRSDVYSVEIPKEFQYIDKLWIHFCEEGKKMKSYRITC